MVSKTEKAFTLTELLIVIGLLVLMMVLALPAVNFITGARSAESATNVISALLGQARAQAIAKQDNVGVIFYWDRTTERTVGAICAKAQPWDATSSYVYGDVVEYPAGNNIYYICRSQSGVAGGKNPPAEITADGANAFWKSCANYQSSMPVFLEGFDLQPLPKGVGLQGVVVPNTPLGTRLGVGQYDRYVSTSCIMFDGEGRLTFTLYGIYAGEALTTPATTVFSRLFLLLHPTLQPVQNITNMGQTQAAIALYDRHTFVNQAFDPNDSSHPETDYIAGDFNTSPPTQPPSSPSLNGWTPQTPEQNEEAWIDANSTFVLINRYNGTLLKSE